MEFNYYGEDYREFEKAFHTHWIGEIPLTYLTDDLLKARKIKHGKGNKSKIILFYT